MAPCLWPAVLAVYLALHLTASEPVMTGAAVDVPPNRGDVQRAAKFAVNEYNKETINEEYAYKTTSISSSKIQVVAGLNFILEVNLGLTQCKKTQTTDVESCPLKINGKDLQSIVWKLKDPNQNVEKN